MELFSFENWACWMYLKYNDNAFWYLNESFYFATYGMSE